MTKWLWHTWATVTPWQSSPATPMMDATLCLTSHITKPKLSHPSHSLRSSCMLFWLTRKSLTFIPQCSRSSRSSPLMRTHSKCKDLLDNGLPKESMETENSKQTSYSLIMVIAWSSHNMPCRCHTSSRFNILPLVPVSLSVLDKTPSLLHKELKLLPKSQNITTKTWTISNYLRTCLFIGSISRHQFKPISAPKQGTSSFGLSVPNATWLSFLLMLLTPWVTKPSTEWFLPELN